MTTKRSVGIVFCSGALALALTAAAADPAPFSVTSKTFKDGQMMPRKVSNANPSNPNCVGDNVSPQLTWTNGPAGTRSFAILMLDPEGRGGAGVSHFVAYGIPADVTSFSEGELSKPSEKYVGGKGTGGNASYGGPCTPPGSAHHYTFVIVATDLEPKELPAGLTREEFLAKLAPPGGPSHAKGSTGIVGLFHHPK